MDVARMTEDQEPEMQDLQESNDGDASIDDHVPTLQLMHVDIDVDSSVEDQLPTAQLQRDFSYRGKPCWNFLHIKVKS
jgi:hypothetical protein